MKISKLLLRLIIFLESRRTSLNFAKSLLSFSDVLQSNPRNDFQISRKLFSEAHCTFLKFIWISFEFWLIFWSSPNYSEARWAPLKCTELFLSWTSLIHTFSKLAELLWSSSNFSGVRWPFSEARWTSLEFGKLHWISLSLFWSFMNFSSSLLS